APDPRNRTFEVTETKKTPRVGPDDDAIPAAYSYMPEFLAHPPMGVGGQNLEPVLEPQTEGGPPGTVLLRVKRAGKGSEAPRPQDLPSQPDLYKYWIDPSRSYVAMRWQMGEGANVSIFTVEALAQSPSGHWYPTVVRHSTVRIDGKRADVLYRFFLDFNAPLP